MLPFRTRCIIEREVGEFKWTSLNYDCGSCEVICVLLKTGLFLAKVGELSSLFADCHLNIKNLYSLSL